MSHFSSFLMADSELKRDGFQHLGYALDGADSAQDTSYWLDIEGEGTVVEGHAEWGKDLYTLTPEMADVGLLPALLKIVRTEKPGLSLEECTSVALARAKQLGFIPIPLHTQSSSASECLAPLK
jgi:hypothetical protein